MALEATHIKFALDLRDRFDVKNLDQYLSGTIYPDSRYITKIERKLTHYEALLTNEFMNSDFKKGWAVHYLCDKMQNQVMDKHVLDVLEKCEGGYEWGSEWWIAKTAMKIIIDIDIISKFDIQPYISLLDYVENPNDELVEDLQRYNGIIQRLYRGKSTLDLEDYRKMWIDFEVDVEKGDLVIQKTHEFLSDAKLADRIRGLYSGMVGDAQNFHIE